jgi:subtilisin family serine protease
MAVEGNDRRDGIPDERTSTERPYFGDTVSRMTAPPELEDDEYRKRWGLGDTPADRGPYMVELNVEHVDGLAGAATAFVNLFKSTVAPDDAKASAEPWYLVKISKSYFRCELNVEEWKQLIAADENVAVEQAQRESGKASGRSVTNDYPYRTIYKLWPDFPVQASITRSIATIKADAALRSFDAAGEGITWAVIDSGIDATHVQFGLDGDHALNDPRVRNLHRCFAPIDGRQLEDPDEEVVDGPRLSPEDREKRLQDHQEHALQDPLGHGTHVSGIIAGRAPKDVEIVVLEKMQSIRPGEERENLPKLRTSIRERLIQSERERDRFHGVAPDCRLVSLRALDESGAGRSSNLVRALEYIRERLNDNPKILRVHGVNMSVGYEFDAEMFACGQSPLCTEVNRLVRSGVVVVTAAGNTGYSTLTAGSRVTKVGLSSTINDPGNSEDAITVGSTHREAPHTFGISYFSSKGPTGDGRLKPDLVAPGERIISCAAGSSLEKALKMRESPSGDGRATTERISPEPRLQSDGMPADPVTAEDDASQARQKRAYYVEDSGTSMAAPHVSGAIAAFLSVRREFIGRPLEVKKIFLDAALPLGRERYFEGHGLVDLMRAIQSV